MSRVKALVTFRELFSPRGRCTRAQFGVYGIGSLALLVVLPLAADQMLEMLAPPRILDINLSTNLSRATILTVVLLACIMVYALFCIMAKRLHDISLPAVTGLLLFGGSVSDAVVSYGEAFMPLDGPLADIISTAGYGLAAVLVVVLCAWPGKRGDNRYGVDPTADEPVGEAVEG